MVANIYLNINGLELCAQDGQSILDIATQNGIEIPTLCHDERVKTFGSCGICLVEVENMPRLVRACSTAAANGMVIKTDTNRVREARTTALEFLLSDHVGDCRPPCVVACPGHTDCQGYVGLIANGEYKEALELIKDVIPLPASIGRVCPHPCEEACRRELVEEPISIAHLKAFAADIDMQSGDVFTPEVQPDTGKRVAIIGGGPGGLTAAYFLRRAGHDVTVYDAMGKMGGMLRYGIPEYRLPKAIVDAEVAMIEKIGVKMVNGVRIGKDVTFDHIKDQHDATVVAIGAWTSTGLRCPGEELPGVIGGIDFLRDVALNNTLLTGKKVAVVGGGNTAMDACRTAVRLGAGEVYNIYRRTKAEMPAEDIEITEAEEEGVIFKYLTNPIEITEKDGRVGQMRLQKMQLGKPDKSGRRAPVPIEGEEETLELDTVIVAIGQGVNPSGFDGLDLTKWRTIIADETTYRTCVEGVFAIGDATNKGAGIAIEAIGDAKRAADVINGYLHGEAVAYKEPFIVKREMTAADFAAKPKIAREKMNHLKPTARKDNFAQVNAGYTEEQAKAEAKRCMECGCADYFECKLINYANQYDVHPEKYTGDVHHRPMDESNPFLFRNPDKCILCGLCVRVCDEVMGRTALGLAARGFDTVVQPELGLPLAETDCISCGQCVTVCPTGALCEVLPAAKAVPVAEETTHSVCSYCSVGCKTKLTTKGGVLMRSLPDDDINKTALLCAKGRFGFGELQKQAHIAKPLIRKDGKLVEAPLDETLIYIAKKAQAITAQHGVNALAVAVSDKYTNEEIYMIRKYATDVLKTENIYAFNGVKSGVKDVFGTAASTNTMEELPFTDVIVLFCEDIVNSHTVAGIKIKQAVENGVKLVLISNKTTQADEWAALKLNPGQDLHTLKAMAKALIDMGRKVQNAQGFDALAQSLDGVKVGGDALEAAKLYGDAKKAMFVFDQKGMTPDAARLIADIAVLAGHVGKPRAGIITLLPNNNSQGLMDMGVNPDGAALAQAIEDKHVKGLLVFGEDIPGINFKNIDFLMVSDYIMTETAEMADVVLPSATAAESNGTYTSAGRLVQRVNAALPALCGLENWQIIQKLANVSTPIFHYEHVGQIGRDIGLFNEAYRGMNEQDFTNGSAIVPFGKNPVLHQGAFAFEDGKARLQVPEGDELFTHTENTHGAYNRFMHFMDSKALLK